MVHLYVVNPTRKLRFLSRLMLRGSSRILKQAITSTSASGASLDDEYSPSLRPPKINLSDFINVNLPYVPQGSLRRDAEYYKDDSEGGFCVFRAENTLFKVHKCYLLREPSAFGDLFSLPSIPGSIEGQSDDAPIPLSDTAEELKDLLWVLYALPNQLVSMNEFDSLSLKRLFNIAKMTNKYCIASYEAWALERILALAQMPMGFLRTASADICAYALEIAVLCNNKQLLDIITHRLVARMLWSDVDRRTILTVAENRGLRKLQGVAYYRDLVSLENTSAATDNTHNHAHNMLVFPLDMNLEKRMCFVAAHHSFVNLWECIRAAPPTFLERGCPSHANCLTSWTEMWQTASTASQTERLGSGDVLGRLKAMMILLKKSMKQETSQVTLGCTLAALESITTTRDDIISGLMDHFQGY